MRELLLNPAFWSAMAQLFWPLALLTALLVFRPIIIGMLKREHVSLKIAGMELNVSEAAQKSGQEIANLQERLAQVETAIGRSSAASGPASAERPSEIINAGILWVDDYPINNAFILDKLSRDGYRVRKELSTEGGMAALSEQGFSLIITDLGRVEAGVEKPFAGLEFIKDVRATNFRGPILVFAGPRGILNRDRLLAAGADAIAESAVDVFKFIDEQLGSVALDNMARD